jgi:hypothetical protein
MKDALFDHYVNFEEDLSVSICRRNSNHTAGHICTLVRPQAFCPDCPLHDLSCRCDFGWLFKWYHSPARSQIASVFQEHVFRRVFHSYILESFRVVLNHRRERFTAAEE